MGDAYTPGLLVTGDTLVRKSRRLPLEGDVLVKVGDEVKADDVIARTELPGKVVLINFANVLGALPDELTSKLLVKMLVMETILKSKHPILASWSRQGITFPKEGEGQRVGPG